MLKKGGVFYIIFVIILLWVACTSVIYSFINPSKTQTEVFLHLPKSFILDFSNKEWYMKFHKKLSIDDYTEKEVLYGCT